MALSANTTVQLENTNTAWTQEYSVKTSSVIYKHALVGITATGLLVPLANSTTIKFVGLAHEALGGNTFPVTGSASVVRKVKCITGCDALLPCITAITVGNSLNTAMYGVDDQTVTTANTLGPQIGTMVKFVAANSAWFRLRAAVGVAAS